VARHAGVSTAVVSYVVNDGPRGVAPDTAERVRESMRVLRYRPNFHARDLKRGSSRTIGLILRDSRNPYFLEFYQAIEGAAAERGLRILVADSHGDPRIERQWLDDMVSRQVDGLFLMSTTQEHVQLESLREVTTPTVLLDCPAPFPAFSSIGPDAYAGAMAAVQHLTRVHGRDSVGLVVGSGGFGWPDPRRLGWERALAEAGLAPGPVAVNDWTVEGGYRAARKLIDGGTLPASMFISSDAQAVGFLRALHEAGLDPARDCPVVSFDGTGLSAYTWPALSSVRQPVGAMAARALDLLEAGRASPSHHSFEVELIVRESCGCVTAGEIGGTRSPSPSRSGCTGSRSQPRRSEH